MKTVERPEFLEVEVGSAVSKYSNCLCDFCHRTNYVIKLSIPNTLYHDGNRLTTSYRQMWICESCRNALRKAIDLEYPKGAE